MTTGGHHMPQHYTPDTLEQYFLAGVPTESVLNERPLCRLLIDPAADRLQLLTPAAGSEPDVAGYERIGFDLVSITGEDGDWFELTVDASEIHYEAYSLLASIVDQLKEGVTFRHALSESLAAFKGLLSGRQKMSTEVQTGLIGELLVLRHAIAAVGEDTSIAAWLGPKSEEHDFGFNHFDAEVKTTKAESRVHQIGSATQLEATQGRPLYLVSVQITPAGAAVEGFTLPELIRSTKGMLSQSVRAYGRQLEHLGWHDGDDDLYQERYLTRSVPRAYLVDAGFPAITTARLQQTVPQPQLVGAVSYRVDVTQLVHASPPHPLDEFCEGPGHNNE